MRNVLPLVGGIGLPFSCSGDASGSHNQALQAAGGDRGSLSNLWHVLWCLMLTEVGAAIIFAVPPYVASAALCGLPRLPSGPQTSGYDELLGAVKSSRHPTSYCG